MKGDVNERVKTADGGREPEWVDGEEVVETECMRVRGNGESLVEWTGDLSRWQPCLAHEQVLLRLRPIVHDDSTHIPANQNVPSHLLSHQRTTASICWPHAFISYTAGQSVSHVLLWQPSEVCSFDSKDCVMLFSENKYDDDDDDEVTHEKSGRSIVNARYLATKRVQ